MEKLLGGSVGAVTLRLVVLSILAGVIMTALGLEPRDLFLGIKAMMRTLYHMGFGIFEQAFGYFLAGAVIVFPVWFLSRLFRTTPSPRKKDTRDNQN